jgi:hypothetical protein
MACEIRLSTEDAMFKGEPEVGDVFLHADGETLLVAEINMELPPDEQVLLLRLDSGVSEDYASDSLDSFKCGHYLAKVQ